MQEMRAGFARMEERLGRVPTTEVLSAHLGSWERALAGVQSAQRDADLRHAEQLQKLERDHLAAINELRADGERGRGVLHTKLEALDGKVTRELKERDAEAKATRRWAIGAALTAVGLLIAVLGLIVNVGGVGG
ncbi:hypothetical protein [Aeromicrobium sp. Leaf291]|uniref:hypothetical protein n=1 Tax=Aeromicrobium sp. Leaf291 TaxID=1736325 RepID=UPI0006FC1AAC|nr:hypothetical protein [Aeromicrobium sp. Leaf291]KQP81563.1 hypothetical protein ASF35_16160 [Aeromicrobium sp. Leaf291]